MKKTVELVSVNNKQTVYNFDDVQKKVIKAQLEPIQKFKSKSTQLPMLFTETGYLHEHANQFLLTRYQNYDFFNKLCVHNPGRKSFSSISLTTLNNIADHIRNWLNICSSQGISYLEADADFLDAVLEIMRDPEDDEDIEEISISIYISTWRLFYEYLDLMHINHRMDMPKKIRQERRKSPTEDNSNAYNYANKTATSVFFDDPLIENKNIRKIKDYSSQALTEKQFNCLLQELKKIDVVYAVMAKCQLDSLMRINEITHYFPHTNNSMNKDWKSYAGMVRANIDFQPLKFIGKGQIEREIDVDIRTIKFLEDKYLTAKEKNSDITIYDNRKSLYLNKYLRSKTGKKSQYEVNSDVLWLSKQGRPISKTMYRNAFKKAAIALRDKGIINNRIFIRPHGLRHTGATLRLIKYSETTGIKICSANIDDIHVFLQEFLGHSDQKTTLLYISTVTKLRIGDLGKKTIHQYEDEWEDEIDNDPNLKRGIDKIKS